MKKPLSLIVLLFCLFTMKASVYETLYVHLKDGTSTQFVLSEKPKVTFSTLAVKVESSTLTMEFEKTNVLKFTYGTGASVDGVKVDTTPFVQQGDKLLFKNLADGSTVAVYNVNGVMMQSTQAQQGTDCIVNISELPAGIYIVNVDTQSYKIIKR